MFLEHETNFSKQQLRKVILLHCCLAYRELSLNQKFVTWSYFLEYLLAHCSVFVCKCASIFIIFFKAPLLLFIPHFFIYLCKPASWGSTSAYLFAFLPSEWINGDWLAVRVQRRASIVTQGRSATACYNPYLAKHKNKTKFESLWANLEVSSSYGNVLYRWTSKQDYWFRSIGRIVLHA